MASSSEVGEPELILRDLDRLREELLSACASKAPAVVDRRFDLELSDQILEAIGPKGVKKLRKRLNSTRGRDRRIKKELANFANWPHLRHQKRTWVDMDEAPNLLGLIDFVAWDEIRRIVARDRHLADKFAADGATIGGALATGSAGKGIAAGLLVNLFGFGRFVNAAADRIHNPEVDDPQVKALSEKYEARYRDLLKAEEVRSQDSSHDADGTRNEHSRSKRLTDAKKAWDDRP